VSTDQSRGEGPGGETAGDPGLIWLRPERVARQLRTPRPTLDREAITRAAVEIADEEGLGGVSMRRIAARLGAGAMSLYWYVPNKADLYELMFDEVIGQIRLPRRSGDWRRDLAAVARATHSVLRRHSWVVLLGVQPGLGPNTRAWGRAAMRALADETADLATQINVLAALNNYIFGFIHREVAWRQLQERSGLSDAEWSRRLADYARRAAGDDPALEQEIAVRLDLHGDASFEFGLECFLDGVDHRLTARHTSG
jgi:AcrR family transcriptional regulator